MRHTIDRVRSLPYASRVPYRRLLQAWRRWSRPTSDSFLGPNEPISRVWGLDRGTPIGRYYAERFLALHARDIRGAVLEMGDARYTRRFGASRVTRSEVLHLTEGHADATLVGDLETGRGVPVEIFDCLMVMFTFLYTFDIAAALATCQRALRPGGILLAEFPGIARISPPDPSYKGDFWRFTSTGVRRLMAGAFPVDDLEIVAFGNVLSASASLYGLAAEEMAADDLERRDPDYEVVICARAAKPLGSAPTS